jgi:HPr kinase/phosphorylase
MDELTKDERLKTYEMIFRKGIPVLIYCRDLKPEEEILTLAVRYNVPVLATAATTSDVMAEIIRWPKVELAQQITIHGVLVDVYGTGVLIMGESGIGKSEAALELIKRGHRLVADDVVEMKKVSDVTLVGSAPEMTRYLIELRGIGIVDVKSLFGVSCVRLTKSVDMVIKLEEWNRESEYDRMGLEDQYIEFMGIKVVCYHLPVRPGRNLAVIVESAAVNHRQKALGYNAAKELYRRVQENLTSHKDR